MTHKLETTNKADNRLLHIIEHASEFTTSDLEGAISAVTRGLYEAAYDRGWVDSD